MTQTCIRCMNGDRGKSTCSRCGRDLRPFTIRETGRYLDPLLIDITTVGWVKLKCDSQGIWFDDFSRRNCSWAWDVPNLFAALDGPYHPLEVLMAQRGWGHRFGSSTSLFFMDQCELSAGRNNPLHLWDLATRWLYWPRPVAALIFHLFTPLPVNGVIGGDPCISIRERLYERLGFKAGQARQAVRSASYATGTDTRWLDFFGNHVYGDLEL